MARILVAGLNAKMVKPAQIAAKCHDVLQNNKDLVEGEAELLIAVVKAGRENDVDGTRLALQKLAGVNIEKMAGNMLAGLLSREVRLEKVQEDCRRVLDNGEKRERLTM